MYRLNIGVGWSVLRHRFHAYSDKSQVFPLLDQHRIILSPAIIEYYEKEAALEGVQDDFYDYIATIMNTDATSITAQDVPGKGIENTYELFFLKQRKGKNKEKSVILTDTESVKVSGTNCRYRYELEEVLANDSNVIKYYSCPFTKYATVEESADWYIKWIQNLVEDENTLFIVDPNFLNENSINCFIEVIYKKMNTDSQITVYCESVLSSQLDRLKTICDEKNCKLSVTKFNRMHCRYIVLQDRIIKIGRGIHFYNSRGEIDDAMEFSYNERGLITPEQLAGGQKCETVV